MCVTNTKNVFLHVFDMPKSMVFDEKIEVGFGDMLLTAGKNLRTPKIAKIRVF